jgi:CRISPR system Cascade subunit CasC
VKLQFHLLTAFPSHNVNRDEDGRPKTALLGVSPRGRISSQAKKRALRFAPHFKDCQRATRTREAGVLAFLSLILGRWLEPGAFRDGMAEYLAHRDQTASESEAVRAAVAVNIALGAGNAASRIANTQPDEASVKELLIRAAEIAAGKAKQPDQEEAQMEREGLPGEQRRRAALLRLLQSEQGLVVSTRELKELKQRIHAALSDPAGVARGVQTFVERLAREGLLTRDAIDEDTALFGRMVAADPSFNVEAAVAVSHAVTTHEFAVEGDYFSAGEELNVLGGTGAAITSYAFFGSGTYYLHAVADVDHLRTNLAPDGGRVARALGGLLDGLAFAQPKGKRNSFASDVCAGYILVDRGDGPTCNLAAAFLEPVRASDPMTASIARLKTFHETLIEAYALPVESLAFNGWQPARVGNAPPLGEVWTFEELRRFVLTGLA